MKTTQQTIALTVHNHPGVMSHITGLFARRAFNLEAIVCVPEPCGTRSRMLLWIRQADRLDQIVRELQRLYDVMTIEIMESRACPSLDRIREHILRIT